MATGFMLEHLSVRRMTKACAGPGGPIYKLVWLGLVFAIQLAPPTLALAAGRSFPRSLPWIRRENSRSLLSPSGVHVIISGDTQRRFHGEMGRTRNFGARQPCI